MNAQQLLQEYEHLDLKQRHDFLENVTQLESINNAQFAAARTALEQFEQGKFTSYKNVTDLLNDLT